MATLANHLLPEAKSPQPTGLKQTNCPYPWGVHLGQRLWLSMGSQGCGQPWMGEAPHMASTSYLPSWSPLGTVGPTGPHSEKAEHGHGPHCTVIQLQLGQAAAGNLESAGWADRSSLLLYQCPFVRQELAMAHWRKGFLLSQTLIKLAGGGCRTESARSSKPGLKLLSRTPWTHTGYPATQAEAPGSPPGWVRCPEPTRGSAFGPWLQQISLGPQPLPGTLSGGRWTLPNGPRPCPHPGPPAAAQSPVHPAGPPGEDWGTCLAGHRLTVRLQHAGPAWGKHAQQIRHWQHAQRAAREQVHLWTDSCSYGHSQPPSQQVGQEQGSRWPDQALRRGMWQLRGPFVLPTATLGSETPQ